MFHSAEANGWELYCKLNLAYVLYKPSSIKTEFAILFGIKIPINDFKQYSKKSFESIDTTKTCGVIRKRRIEKQIFIRDISRALDISRDTYMRLEQGKYQLHHMDKLKLFAQLLEFNPDEIYTPYQIFIMNNQGLQIKKFRTDSNLTQKELAKILSVERHQISRWEKNQNQMPYDKWNIFSSLQ